MKFIGVIGAFFFFVLTSISEALAAFDCRRLIGTLELKNVSRLSTPDWPESRVPAFIIASPDQPDAITAMRLYFYKNLRAFEMNVSTGGTPWFRLDGKPNMTHSDGMGEGLGNSRTITTMESTKENLGFRVTNRSRQNFLGFSIPRKPEILEVEELSPGRFHIQFPNRHIGIYEFASQKDRPVEWSVQMLIHSVHGIIGDFERSVRHHLGNGKIVSHPTTYQADEALDAIEMNLKSNRDQGITYETILGVEANLRKMRTHEFLSNLDEVNNGEAEFLSHLNTLVELGFVHQILSRRMLANEQTDTTERPWHLHIYLRDPRGESAHFPSVRLQIEFKFEDWVIVEAL